MELLLPSPEIGADCFLVTSADVFGLVRLHSEDPPKWVLWSPAVWAQKPHVKPHVPSTRGSTPIQRSSPDPLGTASHVQNPCWKPQVAHFNSKAHVELQPTWDFGYREKQWQGCW